MLLDRHLFLRPVEMFHDVVNGISNSFLHFRDTNPWKRKRNDLKVQIIDTFDRFLRIQILGEGEGTTRYSSKQAKFLKLHKSSYIFVWIIRKISIKLSDSGYWMTDISSCQPNGFTEQTLACKHWVVGKFSEGKSSIHFLQTLKGKPTASFFWDAL